MTVSSSQTAPPRRASGAFSRVLGKVVYGRMEHQLEFVGADPHALRGTFTNLGDPPPTGTEYERVELFAYGESVHLGRCRWEAPSAEGAPGRLVFLDDLCDLREIFRNGRPVQLQQRFDQLPILFNYKQNIAPSFRAFTADLLYDLQVYRHLFDEIDRGLNMEAPEVRLPLQLKLIAAQRSRFFDFFDDRLRRLEAEVRGFSKQENERHGFYFRRQVWDVILSSGFLARTNLRPRGYAGDSWMMQQIYENDYVGASTFGKLMHRHPCETAAAQAVRNRRQMIARVLDETQARKPGHDPLRFMSVACGPAWELRDLFRRPEDCRHFACTLLDQDEEALREAELGLSAVEQRLGEQVQARFMRDSVRMLVGTPDLRDKLGTYHFVYSMGLFDYLTRPVATAVVGKLYNLLEPGGTLIIGNFHVGNPTRTYMEYWMDWVLLYRTEEEMRDLTRELPGAQVEVSFEETRAQMFLHVTRT